MAARKRIDPPSTPADGYRQLDRVDGRDPNRVYVFANPNDPETGVEAYKAEGYEVERSRPDGPRLFAGNGVATGSEITRKGQILMSAPRQVKEALQVAAWAEADGYDRAILAHGNVEGGADPMRGEARYRTRVVSEQTVEEERYSARGA